jgi:hypothetical protein
MTGDSAPRREKLLSSVKLSHVTRDGNVASIAMSFHNDCDDSYGNPSKGLLTTSMKIFPVDVLSCCCCSTVTFKRW